MATPKLEGLIEAAVIASEEKQKAVIELREFIKQLRFELHRHEQRLRLLESGLLHAHSKKPAPIDFGRPNDKRENETIRVLSAKMRESRELCGFTQKVAAELLGVAVSDLFAMELGSNIGSIPSWIIKRAAETYRVPTDFLFGLIDNWDVDDPEVRGERDFLSSMQHLHIEHYSKVISEQIRQDNRLKALNTAVAAFGMAVQHIGEVFGRFRELNPHFDDMLGGASVVHQIELAEELGQHAACVLARYKCLPESLAAHGNQLDEVFPAVKQDKK
jgi:DNA-binding XRE family transcriptional regulator